MAYDVRLATKITEPVDRRLRMLALVKGRPLSHVLVAELDKALPSVAELAALLGDSRLRAEPEPEAA
jgi:hypothetical protein